MSNKCFWALTTTSLLIALTGLTATAKDIRELSQHFNEPGADISPWMFIPEDNVKEMSTAEHPGLMAIWQAGKGKDIKGILKDPIRIDDYPLPWQYQLSLPQNFAAILGIGSKDQMNFAIGMNVAVTFSDPSTWPKDRTQRPPDTHDVQLLVVHLGSTGEFEPGLPQYSDYAHPETYMLWGRGDLDHRVVGDWNMNHVWEGGARYHGPASHQLFFRCDVLSPTSLQIHFKSDEKHGWTGRAIDCSKFGEITGIWEIGPIFSCDRWIPDELCRYLPMKKGYHFYFGGTKDPDGYVPKLLHFEAPQPLPPDPGHEFYVDYCVFFGGSATDMEQLSDDFDILGYLGQWQAQVPFGFDTHSDPGYLTVKLLGPSQGVWFSSVAATNLDLVENHKPPWELEICFIPPEETTPWNFYLNCMVTDTDGVPKGGWRPGVQNLPAENKIKYVNTPFVDSTFKRVHSDWYMLKDAEDMYNSLFDVKFDPEVPEEVFKSRPLYMLLQVIDQNHLRVGFRGSPDAPWHLSKVYDCSNDIKGGIGQFQQFCYSTVNGRHFDCPAGSPMYQKFLFDYIRYRRGLTAE